jgi:beta-mannosidase
VRSGNTKKEVVSRSLSFSLAHGANTLETSAIIRSPELWTIWDRGAQPLYEATLELVQSRIAKLSSAVTFGVRTVELHRSADETRFFINGEPVYLRGATYWPDLYLSNVDKARYERDMQAAMRAGINALRVHVHTENPDRLGIVLIQDNDLNWVFPTDAGFSSRALRHFSNLIKLLRNHPSIVAWIAMNEVGVRELGPDGLARIKSSEFEDLGSRLVAETYKLDPTRPVIENSMDSGNPNSGDTHDYRGSLIGGNFTYFDIFGSKDKLVTEFGVDAPPAFASLSAIPEVASRLSDVLPRMPELHNYQYHLLKYYIEHYRIQKYSPNAGFFLFMWIDFSPQSFYGIYDYWGVAKSEGIGGGLRALQESNQPIGIFMEHNTKPIALYVVNDTSADLGNCFARWSVSTSTGIIAEDSQPVRIGPDSHRRLRDFEFTIKEGETYKIVLELLSPDGRVLAHNSYLNPFQPQARPRGYPDRMDDELGMRLWWADEKK